MASMDWYFSLFNVATAANFSFSLATGFTIAIMAALANAGK
jgi:hypothetical protein